MKISFCKHNDGIGEVVEAVRNEYPECTVTLNKCIGACDKCGNTLIARINGELVEAEDCEILLDIIGEYMELE
ncbi:DUF1450 domain-containing protein [Clostridium tagluense]|uniref:DUF1450 domain-containing protein n=1 Tax=Clostridium tagluense TaxID=360422 RepID=A0A401UJM5_9CLOT|nr:DUF1450 domain-containing protein [Clostridium tagluense]GCD09760.1 hypothetical protein Ctaglu_13830 [Clostridium tagluense]